ncbi:MAG: replication factor C small subunit [Candidatus Bathyarchaeota archaeon]|nr:replication factor C small subunit [Candidatus Bathyarchaeota archaeon]
MTSREPGISVWAEKYRPRTLTEIINQKEIVDRLKGFVETNTMPHCLFAGPAGTGKTTAALSLARDLFKENYADSLFELNASDERGINVVRERVKTFARTRSLGGIPFKILVLDEADNMTSDAQQALRRTMERYTETCRFILICNYSSRIIDPIQSRCAPFRFTPLDNDDIQGRLSYVAQNEGLELRADGMQAILTECQGDLRKAFNTLQAAAAYGETITEDTIYNVAGRVHPQDIREMLKLAFNGEFVEARNKLRQILIEYGVSASDVIKSVHSELLRFNLPTRWKAQLADTVGEIDFRITQGANEEVQFSALLAKFALIYDEMRQGT